MTHFNCHHCSAPLMASGRRKLALCPWCHSKTFIGNKRSFTVRKQVSACQIRVDNARVLAALLAIFLGNLGLHWLYLGQDKYAAWHVVFFVLGIFFWPILIVLTLISLAQGCCFLAMPTTVFNRSYCHARR